MSFNPFMALLTQAALPLAGTAPRVMEFGNQSLTADAATVRRVIERARAAGQDVAGLEAINSLDMTVRRDRVGEFYRCLGAGAYQAIDVNDTYGSLVMDLNLNLAEHYGFRETYDFVTNNGTGEHVFDQGAIFRNAHALTRVGGLMVHVMPFVNYINHGFFSFHPNLYHALAAANGYQLLALGITTRWGDGVIALPTTGTHPGNFLKSGPQVDVGLLVTDAKVPRRNAPRRWLEVALARAPGASAKQRLGLHVHRLLVRGRKLLVFAVLRKTHEGAFVAPIQGRYEGDVAAELDRGDP